MTDTITKRGAIVRDDNNVPVGYKYVNIVAAAPTTTLVKTGGGFLHTITFNKPTATASVEVDDAITNTTPIIGKITIPTIGQQATNDPFTLHYDVEFSTGLSITTSTAASDITVSYI